jgi:hypothetical protein
MATVVNFIDVTLRGAAARTVNLASAQILLTPSAPAFHVAVDGTITPPTITFTATRIDIDAPLTFNCTGGTLTDAATTATTVTLAGADMVGSSATVIASATVNGQIYTGRCTISKFSDGKDGKDADGSNLTAGDLKDILEGQLTTAELDAALRGRIGLIDAGADTAGSVTARVKAETDQRIAAIAQASTDNRTYVQQYTYSQQTINDSFSAFGVSIQAAYQGYADGAAGGALAAAKSFAQTYAYSRADADSALTATANTLRSEFATLNQGTGATVAWVQEYAYSKAQANDAIASATQQLSTTVAGHTSTLEIQGQSISGLGAQYTVKIDNNGWAAGYGLASTPINGVPTSSFIVLADRFAVALPGQTPKFPFVIGTVNGQTVIGLRGDVVLDGTLNIRTAAGYTGDMNATVGADANNLNVGISRNLLSNSAPGTLAGYTFGISAAMNIESNAVILAQGSHPYKQYSPNNTCVYVHAIGTPPDGSVIDIYPNAGNMAPVIPKKRYEAGVSLSSHRCVGQVRIKWFDLNRVYIRENIGNPLADNTANYLTLPFPRSTVFGTAPDNAAFAVVSATGLNNGGSDVHIFASQFYFGEATMAQTVPSNWIEGGASDTRALGYDGDLDATKGAPSGSYVGGTEAGLVASRALNGDAAYNAVNDPTLGLASRMRSNSANVLAAGGGLVAGNLTYDTNGNRTGGFGMAFNQRGIVGFNSGGIPTITMDAATGEIAARGDISGSTGTFGAVRVGVSLATGATSFNNDPGIWQGLVGGVAKMSLVAPNGSKILFDPGAAQQIQLVNVGVAQSPLNVTITTTGGNLTTSYGRNASLASTVAGYVNVADGSGNYQFDWVATADGYPCWPTNPTGSNCSGAMKGPGIAVPDGVGFVLSCNVKDLTTGRTGRATFQPTILFQ